MAKSNKLLFDFFKNKGLDENSYVYSSDIEKLKEEFDDGDGKFSKRELRKMGLDIKRSEVKSVNRTLQAIEAAELADDGVYPVKADDNTTDFYSKDNIKKKSVSVNGLNTVTTEFDETGEKELKIITDMKGFGRVTEDLSNPKVQTITYEGEKLIAKNGGIIKEEIGFVNDVLTKTTTDIDGNKKLYHQQQGTNEWIENVSEPVKQPVQNNVEEPVKEVPNFKEVFEKSGKKVNIDETGSSQRLTKNNTWNTDVIIPKRANYDGKGVPEEIAIALPTDYGHKGSDGVAQKRYQTLKLVDPENNVYSDRAGVRHFQMNLTDDGINLKQVSYDNGKISDLTSKDSDKVKTFLDNNVKVVEKEVETDYQKEHKSKLVGSDMNRDAARLINLENKEAAETLVNRLADRNTSWETYLQTGTENGSLTGSNGLLEKLFDAGAIKSEDGKTSVSYKTYKNLKPAIDGLMASIPDSTEIKNSPEYKKIKILTEELSKTKGTMNHNKVRDLDTALMELAKKYMVNPQGTNYANNSYLRSANNKVLIQPDNSNSMWRTDAKFTMDGKDYYFYRNDAVYDKCYDFQDIVGLNKLITNDLTANNRKGELTFNADKLNTEESYYFQTRGGRKLSVTVENNIAFLTDKDGNKFPLNDILNGRIPMPE